jgi:GTP cyclohydrolase II
MTAPTREGPPQISQQGPALVSPQYQVERCAGDLRRGVPVLIRGTGKEAVLAAAAETLGDAALRGLRAATGAPGALLLTHERATTLKIPLYTPEAVSLQLAAEMRAEAVRAIADPASDLVHPMKGPFTAGREALPLPALASVKLAKLAGLLPATVIFPFAEDSGETVAAAAQLASTSADTVFNFDPETARSLELVARARVPLNLAEQCELAAFRPADGGPEHYAILIGDRTGAALTTPGPVLVRLHSECFTGDLLGSLKCDCGDQLRGAIAAIEAAGGGVLLYLAQEGRGIGMMNKLRAYRLQDEGFDTMEANERLGFAPDERLYDVAARMLTLLGYTTVRLMTNNPEKIRALEAAGIKVTERVPHTFPDNAHNREYLRVKKKRGGHLL